MARRLLGCGLALLLACEISASAPIDAGAAPGDPPRPDAGIETDAGLGGSGNPAEDDDASSGEQVPLCGSAGECDLWTGDGCAAEERCVWVTSSDSGLAAGACFPSGKAGEGEACEGASDCSAGLDCTQLDGTGTCGRYCCDLNETGECPSGYFCRVSLLDDAGQATRVNLCDACDDCDVADPLACGQDLGCYPLAAATVSCTACLPAGPADVGDPCELSTDCVPGAACFAVAGTPRTCIRMCDVGDSTGCPSTITCREVAGGLPDGRGLCL